MSKDALAKVLCDFWDETPRGRESRELHTGQRVRIKSAEVEAR